MIRTETIIYKDESGNPFEGRISLDDSVTGKRPGVLIVHTIRGQTDFEEEKSIELAKLGYIAFAIDMYGQGKKSTVPEENRKLMNELNDDRVLLLQRMQLALQVLKEQEQVDSSKTGAIGFCFGGKCVLDLARSGADVRGVVSFHGLYDKPGLPEDKPFNASVLVLHGWEDPLAKPEQTVALAQELTERQADWQIHAFGHTGHAFTNRTVADREGGFFYQEASEKRSWKLMKDFFEEIF